MKIAKFTLSFFLLFLLGDITAIGCMNEYRALLNGRIEELPEQNAVPYGRFNSGNRDNLVEQLHQADSIYRATGKVEDYSDYGTMLVYAGQYQKAKAVFQAIERRVPGRYATAANLGTTYELLGRNDSAYYWIDKALKINPKSHRGSEWIHLKILEAKMKARGDAQYFLTHKVLSLDFGQVEAPENKNNLDLHVLRDQLYDQLHERMSFVKPEDPIVGLLLFDLGNVTAITMDVKSALEVYEVAKEYGYRSDLLAKRESHFKALQRKADLRNLTEGWSKENIKLAIFILAISLITFLTGLVYLIKRLKKRKKTSS